MPDRLPEHPTQPLTIGLTSGVRLTRRAFWFNYRFWHGDTSPTARHKEGSPGAVSGGCERFGKYAAGTLPRGKTARAPCGLVFATADDEALAVVPALGAHTVRNHGLATGRALDRVGGRERVVGTAHVLLGFSGPSLWYWHGTNSCMDIRWITSSAGAFGAGQGQPYSLKPCRARSHLGRRKR